MSQSSTVGGGGAAMGSGSSVSLQLFLHSPLHPPLIAIHSVP